MSSPLVNYKMSTAGFIFSMIFVLLLGLGAVGVLYYFTDYNPNSNDLTTASPVTQEPVSLNLNLSSPDDNLLTSDPDLLVSGITTPGSAVIISSHSSDKSLEVSSRGDFSATLKLSEGVNKFTIFAMDSEGNVKKELRTVYYSKEKI